MCLRVQSATRLPFDDESVDLVTACQSVHWFDIPEFFREVDRVLVPDGGVLAVYGYYLTGLGPEETRHKEMNGIRDWVSLFLLKTKLFLAKKLTRLWFICLVANLIIRLFKIKTRLIKKIYTYINSIN